MIKIITAIHPVTGERVRFSGGNLIIDRTGVKQVASGFVDIRDEKKPSGADIIAQVPTSWALILSRDND